MTTGELIDWLRYRAIDFGMPSQFIDCIDDVRAIGDQDAEIGALKDELEEAEYQRDQARTILRQLIQASDAETERPEKIEDVVDSARSYFEQ
jgi:hypothetical protein